jgi:hypothetical protein
VFALRSLSHYVRSVCVLSDDGRRIGLHVSSSSTVVEGVFGSCLPRDRCCSACIASKAAVCVLTNLQCSWVVRTRTMAEGRHSI